MMAGILNKVLNKIDDVPVNARICIYGAGREGITLKMLLERFRRDAEIVSFIDTYESGRIQGLEIFNPERIHQIRHMFDLIIVTSGSWRNIIKILDRLEIDNYMIASHHLQHRVLGEYFEKEDINKYWLSYTGIFSEDELEEYSSDIEETRTLLASEDDRKLYDVLIENRKITPNTDVTLRHYLDNFIDINQQYLEFINRNKIRTVIDGGVADGNTTYHMLNNLNQDTVIYGFEPDYKLFMNGHFKKKMDLIPNIHVFPLALWCTKTILNFMEGSNLNAGRVISEDENDKGHLAVDSISIDEFVKENMIRDIDLIKLDVEGAEMDVLEGAKDTIAGCRPQLAISIYHRKEHLFQIPLFINSIVKNYIYKLASYDPSHGEKVFYAIPEEIYTG